MSLTEIRTKDALVAEAKVRLLAYEAENHAIVAAALSVDPSAPASFAAVFGERPREALAVVPPGSGALLVSGMLEPDECIALAASLRARGLALRSVLAGDATTLAFAEAWRNGSNVRWTQRFELVVCALSGEPTASGVPGRFRMATPEDADRLAPWWEDFAIKVRGEVPSLALRGRLDVAIREQRTWLWDVDGVVVSMAMQTGATPNGMALTGVYTPPERRGLRFGAACVASLCRQLQRDGRQVYLFADRQNPSALAMYRRLEFVMLRDMLYQAFEDR